MPSVEIPGYPPVFSDDTGAAMSREKILALIGDADGSPELKRVLSDIALSMAHRNEPIVVGTGGNGWAEKGGTDTLDSLGLEDGFNSYDSGVSTSVIDMPYLNTEVYPNVTEYYPTLIFKVKYRLPEKVEGDVKTVVKYATMKLVEPRQSGGNEIVNVIDGVKYGDMYPQKTGSSVVPANPLSQSLNVVPEVMPGLMGGTLSRDVLLNEVAALDEDESVKRLLSDTVMSMGHRGDNIPLGSGGMDWAERPDAGFDGPGASFHVIDLVIDPNAGGNSTTGPHLVIKARYQLPRETEDGVREEFRYGYIPLSKPNAAGYNETANGVFADMFPQNPVVVAGAPPLPTDPVTWPHYPPVVPKGLGGTVSRGQLISTASSIGGNEKTSRIISEITRAMTHRCENVPLGSSSKTWAEVADTGFVGSGVSMTVMDMYGEEW